MVGLVDPNEEGRQGLEFVGKDKYDNWHMAKLKLAAKRRFVPQSEYAPLFSAKPKVQPSPGTIFTDGETKRPIKRPVEKPIMSPDLWEDNNPNIISARTDKSVSNSTLNDSISIHLSSPQPGPSPSQLKKKIVVTSYNTFRNSHAGATKVSPRGAVINPVTGRKSTRTSPELRISPEMARLAQELRVNEPRERHVVDYDKPWLKHADKSKLSPRTIPKTQGQMSPRDDIGPVVPTPDNLRVNSEDENYFFMTQNDDGPEEPFSVKTYQLSQTERALDQQEQNIAAHTTNLHLVTPPRGPTSSSRDQSPPTRDPIPSSRDSISSSCDLILSSCDPTPPPRDPTPPPRDPTPPPRDPTSPPRDPTPPPRDPTPPPRDPTPPPRDPTPQPRDPTPPPRDPTPPPRDPTPPPLVTSTLPRDQSPPSSPSPCDIIVTSPELVSLVKPQPRFKRELKRSVPPRDPSPSRARVVTPPNDVTTTEPIPLPPTLPSLPYSPTSTPDDTIYAQPAQRFHREMKQSRYPAMRQYADPATRSYNSPSACKSPTLSSIQEDKPLHTPPVRYTSITSHSPSNSTASVDLPPIDVIDPIEFTVNNQKTKQLKKNTSKKKLWPIAVSTKQPRKTMTPTTIRISAPEDWEVSSNTNLGKRQKKLSDLISVDEANPPVFNDKRFQRGFQKKNTQVHSLS